LEPHTSLIRFECEPASELPELLKAKGYNVLPAGTGERLMPVTETITEHGRTNTITRQQVAPTMVAAFEFKLPFG
jgi:hypothetical protein